LRSRRSFNGQAGFTGYGVVVDIIFPGGEKHWVDGVLARNKGLEF